MQNKDGIKVKNLQRNKPQLVEPTEPIYEVEINGETEPQKKNRDVRNQEKRVGWERELVGRTTWDSPRKGSLMQLVPMGRSRRQSEKLHFSLPGLHA